MLTPRVRTQNEYLAELAGIEPFQGLWRRELAAVARVVDLVDIDEGTVIVQQGGRGHELLLVVEGSATATDEHGPSAMLGPSDTVGEVAVIAGAPQPATVTAVTPMRLLVIGRRELLGLLKIVPALGEHLLRGMAERGRTVAPSVNRRDMGKPNSEKKVSHDPGAATEPRGALRA